MTQAIVYTKTDESPMMSTFSLFPIFESFLSKAGVALVLSDISLAGRILARFPEYLSKDQRVEDALANLGELGPKTVCKRDEIAKYLGFHSSNSCLCRRVTIEGV